MGRCGFRFIISLMWLLQIFLIAGCFGKRSVNKPLYFEPPPIFIGDYTGMVEDEDVNWAWLRLGVRLRSYPTMTIKPFKNITQVNDQGIAEQLYQRLVQWCKEKNIDLSDEGELICEGAIVELKLTRAFINKINPFYEEGDDFLLEVELVLREKNTNTVVGKIKHGAVISEITTLEEEVLTGLIKYFEAHR